jgi:hypothetical protein
MAAKVAAWSDRSWDDFVWLFAEAELRLKKAYTSEEDSPSGPHANGIKIDPCLVEDSPSQDDIKAQAEQIAAKNPNIDELHWFLAERKLLYNKVKGIEE